ncbi:MAG: MG2 domain-containing protein, partial [Gemmatimonadota bacterium]|nr:MG2 domain-containing protein [Gemmatimonadota bacterium]
HVLRATPQGVASPTSVVTVTFDRPVAGGLDRTVDPAGLLRIEPALDGVLDWRDPVTLRFRPAAPLPPNTEYTVTVSDVVTSMDGARLEEPFRFSFRVRGPKVLAGSPAGAEETPRFLTPDARFQIVLDAPADPARIASAVRIEPGTLCSDRTPIAVRVAGQREISDDDPWPFREAGGWDRDRAVDSLRRVVQLVPERPLPRGCGGALVLPAAFDDRGARELHWPFATYGDFRIAGGRCGWGGQTCPTGPAVVEFSTPVKGADLLRHVTILPEIRFVVTDTAEERAVWPLEGTLRPRTGYVVTADTALRDVFGQKLTGNPVTTVVTTGYAPSVEHLWGRATVERKAFRTLPVTYVNVDTLSVTLVPIPRRLEATFMSLGQWGWDDSLRPLLRSATRRNIRVATTRDRVQVYGVPLPVSDATRDGPTLYAVQVTSPAIEAEARRGVARGRGRAPRPVALVQVTDLGVHAKIGVGDGAVWVTGASDGLPRAGARVVLHDRRGRELATATTDSAGLARLRGYAPPPPDENDPYAEAEGYVSVTLGGDRALVGVNNYDPDLSPWRFGVNPAWGVQRVPAAGAVFTERGIYRPGEQLHAKAIVRRGMLGALAAAAGDSLRWTFTDREGNTIRRATVALSEFGTADHAWRIPAEAPLGDYYLSAELRRASEWLPLANAGYRVAEYRPPEFLVDVSAPDEPRIAGDTLRASIESRYLFGAPMARAAVAWVARRAALTGWELEIPETEGYVVGETARWWEDGDAGPNVEILGSAADTLDAAGRLAVELPLSADPRGRAARVTLQATVTDVNRQQVAGAASVVVHPADFYLAVKPEG